MCMDFEQKVEKDIKDKKLEVNADEVFYFTREMRVGMEEFRTLSNQAEPLDEDQTRVRKKVKKAMNDAKEVRFDYDANQFTLDEVAEAATFYMKAKAYGYSSEIDVTDNPILYKKVIDKNDGKEKLKKRGYFEKKDIKSSAKKYKKKFETYYETRIKEDWEKNKDKDVYDIGKDASADIQIHFSEEEINTMRNREALKVDVHDKVSRYVFGLPSKTLDKEQEDQDLQRLDRLYDDFGEIQKLMNTRLYKKHLIKQPSVVTSYSYKATFVPGLFVGTEHFFGPVECMSKWLADPQAYGFVKSEDQSANGGLNTAKLKQYEGMMKKCMLLSSMNRQASEYYHCIKALLEDRDEFGITDEETPETIKNHNRKAAEKAKRISEELVLRTGGAMYAFETMCEDIRRHKAYTGADKKKDTIEELPPMDRYFVRKAYLVYDKYSV